MEVAAQHPEAESERPRAHVKKGLLLDRIALNTADVTPGHVQGATPVETYFAHTRLAFRDGTAVPTGVAPDSFAIERFPQDPLSDVACENFC
jgi:hypothetical protein